MNSSLMRRLAWLLDPRTIMGRICLALLIVLTLCATTFSGGWLGNRLAVLAIEEFGQIHAHAGPEGAAILVAVGILLFLTILASLVVSRPREDGASHEDESQQRLGKALLGLYVAVGEEVVLQDGSDVHDKPAMREARDALVVAGLINLGGPEEVRNA